MVFSAQNKLLALENRIPGREREYYRLVSGPAAIRHGGALSNCAGEIKAGKSTCAPI